MSETCKRRVGSVEDRLAVIREVYTRAYDETESFEVQPELTAFLLYACGSIAEGGQLSGSIVRGIRGPAVVGAGL